jgi:hypothetical protein
MPIDTQRRDLIPNTPTAVTLGRATADLVEAQASSTPKRREIDADPDAPNAPTCGPKKYITVDPDDPNAPVCKPKRYIIAPDPAAPKGLAIPDSARRFGAELSEQFRPLA